MQIHLITFHKAKDTICPPSLPMSLLCLGGKLPYCDKVWKLDPQREVSDSAQLLGDLRIKKGWGGAM